MSKVGIDDATAAGASIDDLPRIIYTPELAPDALHGLAGEIVRAIAPYSEAADVATLIHLLIGVGNLIGPDVFARVQEDEHPARLFAVLVGPTSKGRKGTSWSTPKRMLTAVDEAYAARIRSGLSSGEGLISHVRDAIEKIQPVKEKDGRVVRYERVMVDEGEADKRLLIIEPELASVLRRMNGEANSLSAVLRDAWDSGTLATLTKNSPLRATRAHVSLIAHVTREELVMQLTETERANGFANRFLFVAVQRSKCLPDGGSVPPEVLVPLIEALHAVVSWARAERWEVCRDEEARAIWAEVYPSLSEGQPGLLGAITSRAEAQVLRLSVLYAVLDRSPVIRPVHLRAALAVWDYAEISARRIFGGDRLGISTADTILEALRTGRALTRAEINGLFHGNKLTAEIGVALHVLLERGKVRRSTRPAEGGRGRAAEIWEAISR
jgi:hypothetical protein